MSRRRWCIRLRLEEGDEETLQLADAEIGELDAAIAVEKDVGGFDVAVCDKCDPKIDEGIHQLPRDTSEHVIGNG